ncbi:response regulator [Waterburya agarophytonicola K14]|uniref:histidine kinase n=1 Tax=Waterburya agarophytonicola KI4 TaxID=2874699 RepID=A0A964BMU7_9CYAN|nr:response regulator [Waterburya agarophytonicola]MCC0176359.1 response regulator [Waterburya agarophytonicola KI4]
MSSQLDPAILAAITAEARQCFLDEDAPEYLQMLEEGILDRANLDFTALLRAAHSLKGGAGLASLTSLQHLAHKLEDVMLGIQGGQIEELELAWALVEKGIDEVGYILSQARSVDNAIANPELIVALESLVESNSNNPQNNSTRGDDGDSSQNALLHNTLTVDLEDSFIVIEELQLDTSEEILQPILTGFVEECLFLAETLDLSWLGEAIIPISETLTESDLVEALLVTQEVIANLRTEITNYLSNLAANQKSETISTADRDNYELVIHGLNHDLEEVLQAIADLAMDTPEEVINQALAGFSDQCNFIAETLELPWLIEAVKPIETLMVEADPLEALLTVQELVGVIRQQRDLYLDNLLSMEEEVAIATSSSIEPSLYEDEDDEINDEGGFFDFGEDENESQLSTVIFAPSQVSTEKIVAEIAQESQKVTVNQVKIPLDRLQDMTNNVEELILTYSRFGRQQELLNQANRRLRSLTRQFEPIREQIQNLYDQLAISSVNLSQPANQGDKNDPEDNNNFDSLEMDRYTDLHVSLQSFQELMLQIQETRTDIDFVDRELGEDIEQTQKNLNTLYSEVTDSRVVPFDLLAKRFIPQIKGLSQRFDKPVDLKIEGKNTLVDQILLEQLQTPLTHLLNNAFDHGIESKYERFAHGKPETATICLTSKLEKNNLVITIQDDGGGINVEKVYQRAVQRGICPPQKSIKDFQPGEILNWIFEPDFSTAAKVSDISGRGMGLDIVLNLIRQLKGQIQVQTDLGVGTTFTIILPVNLSLQLLLLVQLQNRLVAIPHTSIREILPYRDLSFTNNQKKYINWQGKTIALAVASNLFPCPRKPLNFSQGKVGIVLETAFDPLVILVDLILREEKLIIKPFDETLPVPPSLAGCTVLGTGEVIPVLFPQGLPQKSILSASNKDSTTTIANVTSTILIAEDSVATRKMLDKILTAVGYQVLVCRDGQEALEQIDRHKGRIDLIVSDIEMPRLNGFELLAKIRQKPAFKNTPIIMATSRTGDRHKEEAKRLGATDYLGKPVQPQQLIDTVSALLNKK